MSALGCSVGFKYKHININILTFERTYLDLTKVRMKGCHNYFKIKEKKQSG